MSLSKPHSDKPLNPAVKFLKFKNGTFKYWDKEKEKEIEVALPVKFMVLDELATVTGWHDESQSAIFSNEVHSTTKEDLLVRAFKGGEQATGRYATIKDKIKSNGGKYTKSVYALDLDSGEIVNFHFTGAVLSAWINKEVVVTDNAVVINKTEEAKKGSVTYSYPVFEAESIDKEIYDKAVEIDKTILAPYFKEYKGYDSDVQEFPEDDEDDEVGKAFAKQFEGTTPDDIPTIKRESEVSPSDLPF